MNYFVIMEVRGRVEVLGPFESKEVRQEKFEEAKKEVGDIGEVFEFDSLETDTEKVTLEFQDAEEKKPPIELRKRDRSGALLAEEKGITKGKSGGMMTSWMPSIVAIVVAVLISAAMVFLFNPASGEVKTLTAQIATDMESRIAGVEASVSQSSQQVENLLSQQANYVSSGAIAGLASAQSVTDLAGRLNDEVAGIASINARLDALEVEAEEEAIAETVLEDTVRWRFTDATLNLLPENEAVVEIDVSSKTIDEEDYYDVRVTIEYMGHDEDDPEDLNQDETLHINNYLSLVLTPRGDALLDKNYTNLYSESFPYTEWDTFLSSRTRDGVETTRRVVFESVEPYDMTLEEGEKLRLDFELELGYAR